jgi:hypothetical protein
MGVKTDDLKSKLWKRRTVVYKFSTAILFIWLLIVLFNYMLQPRDDYTGASPGRLVDAFVLIAIGPMALNPMVDLSIESIRRVGRFTGEIFVITDAPDCFTDAVDKYRIKPIAFPRVVPFDVMRVKSLKTSIFDYLPGHVHTFLYMDVDILIGRNLNLFFK